MRIALIVSVLLIPAAQDELSGKQKKAIVEMAHLEMARMLFAEWEGREPKSLKELVEKPADAKHWPDGGYYLGGQIPKDPWGNEYQYEPATRIRTMGADGKRGGKGEDRDLTVEDASQKGKRASCQHLLDNLTQATKIYEADWGTYPPSGSANLAKALSSLGPKKLQYFEFRKGDLNEKGEILDPWSNPIVYRNHRVNWPGNQNDPDAHNPQSFDLYSFGPDGEDDKGKKDDVNNWD